MTEEQRRMARALNRCTFCQGIGTKRFARDMASLAEHKPDHTLTDKQDAYLRSAVLRFRRQIPAAVVEIARAA